MLRFKWKQAMDKIFFGYLKILLKPVTKCLTSSRFLRKFTKYESMNKTRQATTNYEIVHIMFIAIIAHAFEELHSSIATKLENKYHRIK